MPKEPPSQTLLRLAQNVRSLREEKNITQEQLSAKAGLNFTFFKHYFIQTELKGGYINMNDIRTTKNSADSAQQHFWFLQSIVSFGGIFRI